MLLFGSNQPSEMTLIDVFVPITENSGMSMHDLLIIVLDAITILSGVIVFLKILQELAIQLLLPIVIFPYPFVLEPSRFVIK